LTNVIDLDILRPDQQIIKIDGKEVDVSFVPCGITFDLDAIVQQLTKLDTKRIKNDPKEMRRAFDLGVELCAVFCSHKYPEMDAEWFKDNASSEQIKVFTESIQKALLDSYAGVQAHTKN
jgi:hypothetical protein